jgi:hypothetical protein
MKEELAISPVMLSFDSLDELISSVEELIELHKTLLARYGDRLGVLLREKGMDPVQMSMGQEANDPRRAQARKRPIEGVDEGGWMSFETEEYVLKVATTGPSSPHSKFTVSQLFKITEALKTKVTVLEIARKFLSDLPSRGFRADQKYLAVFREGIPRQVIPTNESIEQTRRFRFSDQFEISVLE